MRNKYVLSGDIIEIYKYEKDIKVQGNKAGRAGKSDSETDKKKNRGDSLSRAKKTLRRLINTNVKQFGNMAKFVTLTFAENVTDLSFANNEFKKFIKRLNYELGMKVHYSAVVEFQKRGAVHYHLVFYNVEYIPAKLLETVWGNGFVKINKIDRVDNVGAYVTKYMTKDNEDDRLVGQKSYFNSRGLYKPVELNDLETEKMESLEQGLQIYKRYENTFENENTGKIEYTQYNLSDKKTEK